MDTTDTIDRDHLTDPAARALTSLEATTRELARLASRQVVELHDERVREGAEPRTPELDDPETFFDEADRGPAWDYWENDYGLRLLESYNDLDEEAIAELPERDTLFEYLFTNVFCPELKR